MFKTLWKLNMIVGEIIWTIIVTVVGGYIILHYGLGVL